MMIEVLGAVLFGAIDEAEAAQYLRLPVVEVRRLLGSITTHIPEMAPVAVDLVRGRVELLDLQGMSYGDPFFQDSIDRWRDQEEMPLNVEIGIEHLSRAAHRFPPPGGFIFHVGRCGSTLLANMLEASGEYLVIKEPGVISDIVAHWINTDESARDDVETILGAALRCLLGCARMQRRRVLKFAAWNVQAAGTLLQQCPTTDAVFIYRSPSETVASMLFQPPAWFELIAAPRSLQQRFFPSLREVPQAVRLSAASLFAHAWRSAVEAALALPNDRILLLDYDRLVGASAIALKAVVRHFGDPWDSSTLASMVDARSGYSKGADRGLRFDPARLHHRPPLSAGQAAEVDAIVEGARSCLRKRDPW